MRIAAKFQKLAVCLYQDGFKSALIEMTHSAVATVMEARIRHVEVPHKLGQIGLRSFDDKMKMVFHQHVGMEPCPVDLQGQPKLLKEDRPVLIVSKDFSPLVASAGNVIVGIGVVYP